MFCSIYISRSVSNDTVYYEVWLVVLVYLYPLLRRSRDFVATVLRNGGGGVGPSQLCQLAIATRAAEEKQQFVSQVAGVSPLRLPTLNKWCFLSLTSHYNLIPLIHFLWQECWVKRHQYMCVDSKYFKSKDFSHCRYWARIYFVAKF